MATDNRKQSINTFTGGMVKDLDKSLYKADMYQDATNLRIISERDSNFGVLKNIEGFSEYDLNYDSGQLYCGHCIVRDYVVIWTTDNNGTDQIHRLLLDKEGYVIEQVELYEGDLNLNTANKIVAVGRYESEGIQKVYWVDGVNSIRFANIVDATLSTKDVSYFDIISDFIQNNIEITDILEGGSIKAAQVQYAYMLYSTNGSETNISDSTPMIQLVSGNLVPTSPNFNSYNIDGLEEDESSGKRITLTIDNPNTSLFNRIRLIGIYYTSENNIPNINIIGEYTFGDSITVTDFGSSTIGTYTLEEFTQIRNIFSASALESKDDHLFAANIKETILDFDYDARAYRFNGLNDIGETYTALLNGDTTIELDDVEMAADPDHWAVPLDHDCINPFNNVENDLLDTDIDIEIVNYQFQHTNQITSWSASGTAVLTSTDNSINSLVVPIATTGSAISNAFDVEKGDVLSFQFYGSADSEEDIEVALVDATTGERIEYEAGGTPIREEVLPTGSSSFIRVSFVCGETTSARIRILPTLTVDFSLLYCKAVFYGGEGPNVSYKLSVTEFIEDVFESTITGYENIKEAAIDGVEDIENGLLHSYIGSPSSSDTDLKNTFDNFISPYRKIKSLSFQRDEIYRLAVVFSNEKGISSFAHWIGDIKIPKHTELGFNLFNVGTTGDGVYMRSITIKFQVKVTQDLLDNNIKSFKIVRTTRDYNNRTVLDSGLLGCLVERASGSLKFPHIVTNDVSEIETLDNNIREYISPEINLDKDNVRLDSSWYVANYNLNYYISRLRVDNTDTIVDWDGTEDGLTNHVLNFKKYCEVLDFTTSTYGTFNTSKELLFSDLTYNASENADAYYITLDNERIYNYSMGAWSGEGNDQARGTCIVVNGDPSFDNNVFDYDRGHSALHCSRKLNIIPYGGNTYTSRLNSTYIQTSPSVSLDGVSLDSYESTEAIGDTYIFMFEHLRTMMSSRPAALNSKSIEVLYIPVESMYNDHARTGIQIHKTYWRNPSHYPTLSDMIAIHETPGVYAYTANTNDYLFTQDYYLYDYNKSYNIENSLKEYYPKPFDFQDITDFDYRVKASQKKINNEYLDSWTVFLPFDFKDVDSRYGPINNLMTVNNRLMYWQDHGFGILSVNERSLISDNNPGQLVLGTGGILDRHDYISENVGNTNRFGIAKSISSVYWIDNFKKEIYRFNQKLESLSSMKYIKSYLNNYKTIENVILGYDNEYNEMLFTIYGETLDNHYNHTLVFNEQMDVFQSFYTMFPSYYINHELGLLSGHSYDLPYYTSYMGDRYLSEDGEYYTPYTPTYDVNSSLLHKHNDGEKCVFENSTIYPSTLKILCNDNYNYIKVFDNIIMSTSVKLDQVEYFNETINDIRFYNEYQNTDWRELVYKTTTAFPQIPFERRERHISLVVPRNIVSRNVIENANIFEPSNMDETNNFKERIRDSHMFIDLNYDNSANKELSINYIVTKYRISYR